MSACPSRPGAFTKFLAFVLRSICCFFGVLMLSICTGKLPGLSCVDRVVVTEEVVPLESGILLFVATGDGNLVRRRLQFVSSIVHAVLADRRHPAHVSYSVDGRNIGSRACMTARSSAICDLRSTTGPASASSVGQRSP
jgi:hypothetical protein